MLGGGQMPFLSPVERERYDRQMSIAGWGAEGQERIKRAVVFVAGAGGLGSPAAAYLAAAGVGRIRICDRGIVDRSNLNRQLLHSDRDAGRPKIESAVRSLKAVNPHVEVVGLPFWIDPRSVGELVADAALIVDCLDNFETRYVLNDHAVRTRTPLVHAGVYGLSGQLTFIHAPDTPCLRCVFPEPPPAGTFPILGATAGVVGCLEAMEALKYLAGIEGASNGGSAGKMTDTGDGANDGGSLLKGRLLIWEGDSMRFTELPLEKDPRCPVCGGP